MESLLLNIDIAAPSLEDLNAIFRSAHSIKGGSGTFGFNDMTEVTHILENLLDRLRKQELKLTDEMVNVFLEASDVIHMQLNAHRGEGEVVLSEVRRVCEKLAHLASSSALPDAVSHAGASKNVALLEADVGCSDADFFDEVPATPQGYGFFEDELGRAIAAVDPGYGFFDDEPAVPIQTTDLGYGFFEDIREAPLIQKADFGSAADEYTQLSNTSQQGYGFFQEIAPQAVSAAIAAVDDRETDVRLNDVRETISRRAGDKAIAETSIRVNVEKVDDLINLVGELVITQAMLTQSAESLGGAFSEKLQEGLHQLARNTRNLQEVILSVRMLPISFVFSRFPRVVRELAGKLGKQVELKLLGEGTELDKGLIEKIADPLTHLVRNSLDHGIESPKKRIDAGKSAKGTITLKASHQGGNILIEVTDDGGGLNRSKILAKARERGMVVRDDMTDAEVWMLIFEAGFSTADVVSDVSGRGVGMDVVKRNIAAMGGRVEIDSVEGIGTRISIRLPLTMAILDGLSVAVGEQTYIIPLAYIVESLLMTEGDLRTISGEGCLVNVRGEYLPLVALHDLFSLPRQTESGADILVIVEADGKKTALLVDELIGQHQVVIKSLEANFRKLPGISGATIMGDGSVALILDVAAVTTSPAQRNSSKRIVTGQQSGLLI